MTGCIDCLRPPGGDTSSPSGQFVFQERFVGLTSAVRVLLRSKEPLRSRTADGGKEVSKVQVSALQMEGDPEETDRPSQQRPELCHGLHRSVHDRENSAAMRAVLCAQVCRVYRFQTEDRRWLLVREQMSETPLSFGLPKEMMKMLLHELTNRVQAVKQLGDLPPHWNRLRLDVIDHCNDLIRCYQETLGELDKLSASSCFKSSTSKSEQHLQFIPTNLHAQRMEVTGPDNLAVWYNVVTFGAPADHHQAFKHGGLKRLLCKHAKRHSFVCYSQDEGLRARELLASVAQLQPLIFGLAEELLSTSLEMSLVRLKQVSDSLVGQTEQFVHAVKDELVKSALEEIHECNIRQLHANGDLCNSTPTNQNGLQYESKEEEEYDEEEWDRAWANVTKSINCIVVMMDRLQGKEARPHRELLSNQHQAMTEADSLNTTSSTSWQEQLLPLVVTLRDCVREAVEKAQTAMTFVVLQEALTVSVAQGPSHVLQRRHAVFSQTLSAVVCGFMLKLQAGLDDPEFLQQLHKVGVLAQFEGLLSTYGEEIGMLEDMEVGVADLRGVRFTIAEAKTERPDDLLPTISGTWDGIVVKVPLPSESFASLPTKLKEGCLIPVCPVLFNIGINQQQSFAERFGDSSLQERVNQQNCECLKAYCRTLEEALPNIAAFQSLPDLLVLLDRSLEAKKRKNVEVLWNAAMVCRRVNGVRLTSCKSAKDRTAMSVTLEQCLLLRERHALSHQHFGRALDNMRRDGCRMENVQKNIGSRRFAFSAVQLLTFPKLYRPPDGSYG